MTTYLSIVVDLEDVYIGVSYHRTHKDAIDSIVEFLVPPYEQDPEAYDNDPDSYRETKETLLADLLRSKYVGNDGKHYYYHRWDQCVINIEPLPEFEKPRELF